MRERVYGYVRVSTKEQNEDRQTLAMSEFGVPPENIYIDKQSGRNFARPEYQRMMKKLKPGDTLAVKSIDRLGRNYEDVLKEWRFITKKKRVSIVVLDMPILDTRRDRDLTGTLISDLILQIMSYMAEMERRFIRQRQAEGIAAAKARGVRFGRKPKERPSGYETVQKAWERGELSARRAGQILGVDYHTFLMWTVK